MTLDDILLQARKVGASDVHVSVGIPCLLYTSDAADE